MKGLLKAQKMAAKLETQMENLAERLQKIEIASKDLNCALIELLSADAVVSSAPNRAEKAQESN